MSAPQSTPAPREIIAGRYRIEERLGRGGMGSVWRAQHLTLRSPVAIKLISPALASSEEAVARFLREAQAAASLRSPHVVQILDHGVDEGMPYIAMELLEGESLAERLARTGKLSFPETARVLTHVARAMMRAHEAGVVHRDLKPDNVFIVRNDDEEIAKVLDFGIAKAAPHAFDVTTGTRTGTMLGTPYYMSPEQIDESKTVDHRTDLWAMAVIAFECVTGVRPFQSDTLGTLLLMICSKPIPVPSQVAQVPPGFDEWFARSVQRNPSERFQSAREFADSLRVVLTPGTGAEPVLPTPPWGTLSQGAVSAAVTRGRLTGQDAPGRRRLVPVAIGLAGVLLLALTAWLLRESGTGGKAGGEAHVVVPAPSAQGVEARPQVAGVTAGVEPATAGVQAAPVVAPMPEVVASPTQALAAPASARRLPVAPATHRRRPVERAKTTATSAPDPQREAKPATKATDLGF